MGTDLQQYGESALSSGILYEDAVASMQEVRRFVASQLKDGVDYGTIPGAGARKVLHQPGAQKILMFFQCYPQNEIKRTDFEGGHCEWMVVSRIISRTTDRQIAEGVGACSTLETKYSQRSAELVCPSCGKPALIRSKAEYGGGYYCLPVKGGCKAKFGADDDAVTSQTPGKVQVASGHDQRNTALKMASKRALVSAAESLACLSEFFGDQAPARPQGNQRRPEPPRRERDREREPEPQPEPESEAIQAPVPFPERVLNVMRKFNRSFEVAVKKQTGRSFEGDLAEPDLVYAELWRVCQDRGWRVFGVLPDEPAEARRAVCAVAAENGHAEELIAALKDLLAGMAKRILATLKGEA